MTADNVVGTRYIRDRLGIYRINYTGRNIAPNSFSAGFGIATIPKSVKDYIRLDAFRRGYQVKYLNAFSTEVVSARIELLEVVESLIS